MSGKGSYAAIVATNNDNQPEGSRSDAPPAYSQDQAKQPPPQPQSHHQAQSHHTHQHQSHPHPHVHYQQATPSTLESGGIIIIGGTQYIHALSRARRRFFGALAWAAAIYFVAVWVFTVVGVLLLPRPDWDPGHGHPGHPGHGYPGDSPGRPYPYPYPPPTPRQ